MFQKLLSKATLNPHKFQLELTLHKLDLAIENPSCTISVLLQLGQQTLSSLQKLKAERSVILEEKMTLTTSFYQDAKGNYQEKLAQLTILLSNGKNASSIGQIKFDVATYAKSAGNESFEVFEIFQLEKSPEYQVRAYITMKAIFRESEQNSSSMLSKIRKTVKEITKSPETATTSRSSNMIKRSKTPVQEINDGQKSDRSSRSQVNGKSQASMKTVMKAFQNKSNKTSGDSNLFRDILKKVATPSPMPTPPKREEERRREEEEGRKEERKEEGKRREEKRSEETSRMKENNDGKKVEVLSKKFMEGILRKKGSSKSPFKGVEKPFKPVLINSPVLSSKYKEAFEEKMKMFKNIDNLKEEKSFFETFLCSVMKTQQQKESEIEQNISLLQSLQGENLRLKRELENVRLDLFQQKYNYEPPSAKPLSFYEGQLNNLKEIYQKKKREEEEEEEEKSKRVGEERKKREEEEGLGRRVEEEEQKMKDAIQKQFQIKNEMRKEGGGRKKEDGGGREEDSKKEHEVKFRLLEQEKELERLEERSREEEERRRQKEEIIRRKREEERKKKEEEEGLESKLKEEEEKRIEEEAHKRELEKKDEELKDEIEGYKENLIKTKHELGNMMNLIFEKGSLELMEEMDKLDFESQKEEQEKHINNIGK